jgi:hypothetical protein
MIEFDQWPVVLKRAVEVRDAKVKPIMATLESLDVSWTIVQGNLGDLAQTMDMFAGEDQEKTIALWRQPPLVKHNYHLRVVRVFHNFLSSAVAYIYHLDRATKRFKPVAGTLFDEWHRRQKTVRDRLHFLEHLRDFSLHNGTHQSALTLRFTESGEPFGQVGFSVPPVLADLEARNPRDNNEKLSLQDSIARLKAETSGIVEIRPVAEEYYHAAAAHREWFRKELLNLYSELSNDLARWAPPADRAAIEQLFIENPIPVYGRSE